MLPDRRRFVTAASDIDDVRREAIAICDRIIAGYAEVDRDADRQGHADRIVRDVRSGGCPQHRHQVVLRCARFDDLPHVPSCGVGPRWRDRSTRRHVRHQPDRTSEMTFYNNIITPNGESLQFGLGLVLEVCDQIMSPEAAAAERAAMEREQREAEEAAEAERQEAEDARLPVARPTSFREPSPRGTAKIVGKRRRRRRHIAPIAGAKLAASG